MEWASGRWMLHVWSDQLNDYSCEHGGTLLSQPAGSGAILSGSNQQLQEQLMHNATSCTQPGIQYFNEHLSGMKTPVSLHLRLHGSFPLRRSKRCNQTMLMWTPYQPFLFGTLTYLGNSRVSCRRTWLQWKTEVLHTVHWNFGKLMRHLCQLVSKHLSCSSTMLQYNKHWTAFCMHYWCCLKIIREWWGIEVKLMGLSTEKIQIK